MPAEAYLLILAMLAQAALALGLVWYLGVIRLPLIIGGKVRIRDIALSRDPWPEQEKQVSNAVDNQFQLPVLLYVASLVAILLGPGWPDVVLAFAFVATRYVHAAIHITSNHVVRRFWAYTAGLALLTVLCLLQVTRVIGAAASFSLGPG